jgi:hypothetical protein
MLVPYVLTLTVAKLSFNYTGNFNSDIFGNPVGFAELTVLYGKDKTTFEQMTFISNIDYTDVFGKEDVLLRSKRGIKCCGTGLCCKKTYYCCDNGQLCCKNVTASTTTVLPTSPVTTIEPPTEKPMPEEPVTEEPTTEKPMPEEPVTEEPTTEEPKTEKPVLEKLTTEKPPTVKSTIKKLLAQKITTTEKPYPLGNAEAY